MKPDLTTIAARVAGFSISRRVPLFALCLLFFIVPAFGLLKTNFDGSFSALLTKSDPYLEEVEMMDAEFPAPDSASFIFVAGTGQIVFDREILAALDDLRKSFRSIPTADSLSTILDWISPQTQRRLFAKSLADYSEKELHQLAAVATQDRLLTNNLLSRNGELTFANLTLRSVDADEDTRQQVAAAIRSLLDELRQRHPGISVYAGSDLILEQVQQASMIQDLTTLMPFVIIICVLVICYCFRSISLGACVLIHAVATVISTIGMVNLLGYSYNSISVLAPLVVIIIAIASCVHIISIYKQALQQGMKKLVAMEHSLAGNFLPVSLAAITTTIGFSSLKMTSSSAIQEFGEIAAIGIVLSYVLTFALLPAMMVLLTRWMADADPDAKLFLQDRLEQLVRFIEHQDRKLFVFCTSLAVVTALLLPLNETDFNRLDFIANDYDTRQYYDQIANKMNRGPALSYGIDTGVKDGVLDIGFLQEVERFGDWLQTGDVIESQASLVEVLKTINQFINDQDPDYFTLPENEESVSNYLEAFALVNSQDFPLGSFVNEDASAITLTINATRITNQEVIDLDQRITDNFPDFFQSAELIHGSALLLFSRMDELVTVELLQGYSVSLLLITLTLMFGLGSIYFGILSVVPNLLPATMVFGFWALLVGQLDPFVMMLFSISIGLVVDDTVHILSHYLESRRRGSSQDQAISRSIRIAGPALAITTLVLALGTTILIFANTMYFKQSAKLLVPIVVLALVLDLAYFPSVLRRFDRKTVLHA